MAKLEWGAKRLCGSCGCRFYDLGRNPILCPKCGVAYETEAPFRGRRSSVQAEAKPAPIPVPAVEDIIDIDTETLVAIEDEEEAEGEKEGAEEEDEALIEDASDLGVDDDDMAEVMEHMDEEPEDEA